jgi:hypothetical protein
LQKNFNNAPQKFSSSQAIIAVIIQHRENFFYDIKGENENKRKLLLKCSYCGEVKKIFYIFCREHKANHFSSMVMGLVSKNYYEILCCQ